ncbi:MAG: Hsp20/alpha crystallin family protein [Saprospiraceae bacterium]|uniref:Hsp20/alpha crystallin family protein n=1 Tax=Candidatus Opimibacter skivensis TaxID=2982028 RepID=A0A9D7SS61_9BACT|nr:Hsp20/alpha crystallin family protein [Candidatus Opimibacter skivensis]
MNHTKFNQMQPSDTISKWIDTLFNTTLSDAIGMDYSASNPAVNVTEEDAKYNLQLAAPGLTKQDFNIRIENDHLIISVEKKNEKDESVPGRFYDVNSITAHSKNHSSWMIKLTGRE